nr:putative reverse transcriptase domain-containing protein [Tanacetum cinerariifolium]
MDFVSGLPRSSSGYDSIWVIVDRLKKSAYFLPMKKTDSIEKLTQLYLKKVVYRLGVPVSTIPDQDSRFPPGFWRPFKVIDRIGPMAYKLELPDKLCGIHDTFHVSYLKKFMATENLVIPLEEIQLDDKLHFIKKSVDVIDREVKQLKQSRIPIVKVRWNSWRGPEFTREREYFFKSKYPHLFSSKQKASKKNRAPGRCSLKGRRMNKPIVSKVSTTTSSPSPSLDVTALTEIVKELVLMNKATQQATVKATEETCVTCGGPHPYYDCRATGGNTLDACAVVGPYNQGANPKGDLKAITTRSGVAYEGPSILPTSSFRRKWNENRR